MAEITEERINQLRISIHKLRVFFNYSISMKKKFENKTTQKKIKKKFNEEKIQEIEAKELNEGKGTFDKNLEKEKIIKNKSEVQRSKTTSSKIDNKITVLPGQCVVNQGEKANTAFLILSGSFNVEIDKKVVGSMHAGEIFGELSLILGENRKATVRAITGSELAEINPSFLKTYFLNSKTNTDKVTQGTSETQKIIKELSTELGKNKGQKLSISYEKLVAITKDESNIIRSLSLQLHKRLTKMINDNEKKDKIKKMNN